MQLIVTRDNPYSHTYVQFLKRNKMKQLSLIIFTVSLNAMLFSCSPEELEQHEITQQEQVQGEAIQEEQINRNGDEDGDITPPPPPPGK